MKIRYLKNQKRSVLVTAIILAVFFVLVPNKSLAKQVTVKPNNFTTYFSTTGSAYVKGNQVILTEDTVHQVGGLYLNKRIDTIGSFTLKGQVYLGNKFDAGGGGDGMSFIFHPNEQNILGSTGATLGMKGIPNLTGFRLDTFYNKADPKNGEPDDWPGLTIDSGWRPIPPKMGKASTPFGGFATTNVNGQVSYEYGSNDKLNKSLFLNNNVGPQPITVSYNATNGNLSIDLAGQQWSRDINYSPGVSLAFQVQAATGDNHNLQYFVFDSFTFNEDRQITVKEVWDHTGNEGNKPNGGYTLLENGNPSGDPIVTEPGTEVISYTRDGLKDDGDYSIKPTEVDHYVTSYEKNPNDPDSYTITRKYNPNEIKINVKDTWDDNNDSYGLRPETSSFQMKANDAVLDTIYQNSAGNDWAQEITLPERDNDGKGDPIKYSVVVAKEVPDYETSVNDNEDGSFTITHTLKRVIKLMSVPELLKWTGRTIPMPNKVLNRDAENDMTVTVMDTTSNQANWDVTAKLENTNQSSKLYSLIWKENANVSDAEAKDLVGQKVLTNQSTKPNANQTYLYEKTWGADAGILLKTKDYVPIGEYKELTIHWTLENVAGTE